MVWTPKHSVKDLVVYLYFFMTVIFFWTLLSSGVIKCQKFENIYVLKVGESKTETQ